MPRTLSKGSRFWLFAFLAAVLIGAAGLLLQDHLVFQEDRRAARVVRPAFELQAHRGGRGLMPENTLPAFARALSLGVTTLELDLAITRDGVVVVHHDRRLSPERSRGPDGAWISPPGPLIKDLTLAELQQADVGASRPDGETARRFPAQRRLDGVRVPSLEQVIELAEAQTGGRILYSVEAKVSPLAPEETLEPAAFARAVIYVLAGTGVLARASLQSFDWRVLRAAQEQAPALATVFLTAEQDWFDNVGRKHPAGTAWTAGIEVAAQGGSLPQAVKAARGEVWSPHFRDLSEAELREAQSLGLRVVVWTVNEPAEMARLLALGVDGIVTDYPDRLRAAMAEAGLPLPPAFPAP
ncbi:MAG: glycerophosphodiester phosphodiesterase [Kiloniellales bacterium]|nr:glycerophosphodiester phosphodiesterase [Kiloniellales bacterium]